MPSVERSLVSVIVCSAQVHRFVTEHFILFRSFQRRNSYAAVAGANAGPDVGRTGLKQTARGRVRAVQRRKVHGQEKECDSQREKAQPKCKTTTYKFIIRSSRSEVSLQGEKVDGKRSAG